MDNVLDAFLGLHGTVFFMLSGTLVHVYCVPIPISTKAGFPCIR